MAPMMITLYRDKSLPSIVTSRNNTAMPNNTETCNTHKVILDITIPVIKSLGCNGVTKSRVNIPLRRYSTLLKPHHSKHDIAGNKTNQQVYDFVITDMDNTVN